MKIRIHSFTSFLPALLIIHACAGLAPTAGQASLLIDRIVAVVENDIVTEGELRERINVIRVQAGEQADLPADNILAEQVLQRIIMERLQIEWGKRRGISTDDISLDQAMRNLAQRNGMTLDRFRDTLLRQGIDYIAFRDQMRAEMTIAQVIRRAVQANIQISDKEVDALLASQQGQLDIGAEFHIAHILIQLPQDPGPEDIDSAKTKIEQLHTRAINGESFTQLAIAHSQAQDALEGGDLGWRNRNQLPAIFSRQLANMRAGDISEVLRSPSGFHIFHILDTRGNDKVMVEQLFTRHILITTNALRGDKEVQQDLSNLRARIINGEDFGALARAHSNDTGSASDGGELGWMDAGALVPAFREVAQAMPLQAISEPFKSRFGWHILQVLDKRKHDNSVEARRSQARNFLQQRKMSEERELWLRQLRGESYVENRLAATAQ